LKANSSLPGEQPAIRKWLQKGVTSGSANNRTEPGKLGRNRCGNSVWLVYVTLFLNVLTDASEEESKQMESKVV
jgi:hypothetical protein